MSDNTDTVDMDLDTFETAFYSDEAPKEEGPSKAEESEDTGDDAAETDEDTDAPEGDDEDTAEEGSDEEDEAGDEEDPEPEPEPKKGKNRKSLQARIDELTRRAYEAERREIEVLRRLEMRESREREVAKEAPVQESLPQGAPNPEALDADGNPLFPLGKFDPDYVEALTRYTIREESAQLARQQEEARVLSEIEAAQTHLKNEWAEKVEAATEENPEIRENIGNLTTAFANIEPAYGEYLALTIMQSENGPQILDYLSQNIGEAQNIVASGPAAATLALGRLDAALARREEKSNARAVTRAPEPPEAVTRGRKGSKTIRPDTDNLDDFEKAFFQ